MINENIEKERNIDSKKNVIKLIREHSTVEMDNYPKPTTKATPEFLEAHYLPNHSPVRYPIEGALQTLETKQ